MFEVLKVFARSEPGCVSTIVEELKDDDGQMRWELHPSGNELLWVRAFYPSDYPEGMGHIESVRDFMEALAKATSCSDLYNVEPFTD